ncbi:MAG: hypothetical protein HYX59_12890 [Elusimicrobia bacterium]|nr:hypothetical protein [Elusimicrobiota bacterium]
MRFKNPAIDLWGAKRWRWRVLAINFSAHADVLKESVAEHIDRIRAEVRAEFPEWLRRADGPMEKYLAAWDLREKKNWPYLKIAKKLFPKKAAAIARAERNTSYSYSAATMKSVSMDDGPDLLSASEDADPESWTKLIRRYCGRAQALIDGHYQALS